MFKRILVIDDQQAWRDALKLVLKSENIEFSSLENDKENVIKSEELDVLTADNKENAMLLIDEIAFDIAIVDLRLDDFDQNNIDGLSLLAEVKDKYPYEQMETLILTGYGTYETQREAFKKYGVVDFIDKAPLDNKTTEEQLLHTIKDIYHKKVIQNLNNEESVWKHTFTDERMRSIASEFSTPGWTDEQVATKLKGFLEIELLKSAFFPFSANIVVVPPDENNSIYPTVRIYCWSRALGQAIAMYFQQNGTAGTLLEEFNKHEEKWKPKMICAPTNKTGFLIKIFALSSSLSEMKFRDFLKLVDTYPRGS